MFVFLLPAPMLHAAAKNTTGLAAAGSTTTANLNIDPKPDFCNLNTSLTWAQTQTRITHHNLERHTYTKNLSKHIDFSPSYVLPMLYRVIDMDWSYSRQLYCGFVYRSTRFWDDLNLKKCSINILFFEIK